ncbi:cytochrome-c peroxidase [Chondromyces crocatus]|uniref:Cytochrome C peroxidase n=1 Tax=Chondromyces crocatus TaxID=52 RepID=A0A0K1E5Z2_CHOCO|nr:cytochrome-c peroxidase [Chondromyces crocatus]AKT36295.1 cytochrome C peroxidase [Chondromyces crocatus]
MRRRLVYPHLGIGLLALGVVTSAALGCSGEGLTPPPTGSSVAMTANPPPPISGGTLLVTADGRTAVAGDPDRHGIWLVDLEREAVNFLPVGELEEPGRVVEGALGRAHVALRRGGAVLTLDLESRSIVDRRDVCVAPSGMAYDAASDTLHVACMGGELIAMPAAGGAATRKLRLDRDLRDVVVDGDRLLVTMFRSAETLVVDASGEVLERRQLPAFVSNGGSGLTYVPSVAWRMASVPGGGALVVHQRAQSSPVVVNPGQFYYGNPDCDGNIVHTTVSLLGSAQEAGDEKLAAAAPAIPMVGLPVDVAVSRSGEAIAVVGAGNDRLVITTRSTIVDDSGWGSCMPGTLDEPMPGQPVAVAFKGEGEELLVQLREPAGLVFWRGGNQRTLSFPGASVRDTGHEMFHRPPATFAAMSCASCHPQGHEDGHTWNFDPIGLRRTQALGGGILQTAPLHWDGDMEDLEHLMGEVLVGRMAGNTPSMRQERLMARFLDSIPAFPASPPEDPGAVLRGEALFKSEAVGCASCHSGSMLTNNRNESVGRDETLQVPTLIGLSGRAPFMHDGCAATLHDRFDPACGGSQHGDVSRLTQDELDDLVVYLESL